MCEQCQNRITLAAVLVHDLDRTQRVLLRATVHAEARPHPTAEQRRVRLQVATALINAELRDTLGPIPGPDDHAISYEQED